MKWYDLILVNNAVLSVLCLIASADLFSAIIDLEPLLDTEEEIIRTLDKYFEIEEQRLLKLRRLRSSYEKLHKEAKEDVSTFLSNPVNAFLLVKRLTSDWQTAGRLIEGIESRALIENVTMQGYVFPDDEDLNGAAVALMRLQDTYLLDTEQLAQRKILGAATSSNLTAEDCFELGYQAYKKMDFYHAILWLKEAYNQLREEDSRKIRIMILEYLAHSYFMTGNIEEALIATEKAVSLGPEYEVTTQNLAFYRAQLRIEVEQKKGDTGLEPQVDTDVGVTYDEETSAQETDTDPKQAPYYGDYEKLCRGERLKSSSEERSLVCRYTSNNSTYLLLQPLREEVLNLNPRIVVYHNVISEADADLFKEIATPLLNRATVSDPQTGENKAAEYRVSKSAWVPDHANPRVAHASRMVGEITGLATETAEHLHVVNYGIGGHYEPHLDFRRENEVDSFMHGNRIATWIFYLSDVEAGGSTVFPDIGVEVKPEKGSAALWYNLLKNGQGVLETKHAACPVLSGSKWVGNKWLHERGQEFRRPCSSNKLE